MAQKPLLTYERAKELLRYNPQTGVICWRVSRPGIPAGAIAGTPCRGYVQIEVDGKFYRAHRIAWLLQTGRWPDGPLDHRNRVRNDNRWRNLREATHKQNAFNRAITARNKSGVVGVYYSQHRGKWGAEIGNERLGFFEDKPQAIKARRDAERIQIGEFAPSLAPSLEQMQEGAI